MSSELEELVEFLHHGNTQIRQLATENLVPFSKIQPSIFKTNQCAPIKDLKLLVRDYAPIAKNALIILINLSGDLEVLKRLAEDDAKAKPEDSLLETILMKVTCLADPVLNQNSREPNADAFAMLLANIAKSPSIERLITLDRSPVPKLPTTSKRAITQLIEIYNIGSAWNTDANHDYLGYVFGDLAKYPSFSSYITTPSSSSSLDPLVSFLPHTIHISLPRRLGTALLLRNLALSHPDVLYLLQPVHSVLEPLLLPLCSSNQGNITEEEMETLPEECQLLPPEHKQEDTIEVVRLEVETLWLLAARGGTEGRKLMRERGCYVVVRELHLDLAERDEAVKGWCEKIVDVLMGDGGGGVDGGDGGKGRIVEVDADEEDEIVPIF